MFLSMFDEQWAEFISWWCKRIILKKKNERKNSSVDVQMDDMALHKHQGGDDNKYQCTHVYKDEYPWKSRDTTNTNDADNAAHSNDQVL